MAKFDIVPGLRFVSRDSWGADTSIPRLGDKVTRDKRTHVIVHHTVMIDPNDGSPDIWETEAKIFKMMRSLQRARPDLGLDVPYSFVAFLSTVNDGLYICEGRGEDRSGAHTTGHNTKGIGISFAGDFENATVAVTDIAKRMPLLSFFLGWLRFSASHPDYGTFPPMKKLDSMQPQGRHVFFHRDFKATACPGKKLMAQLMQVNFIAPT